MNITTPIFNLLRAISTFLAMVVGFLFDTDDEIENRPLENGSDFFGEHNFRTGRMDSGTDPDGWYEEDL